MSEIRSLGDALQAAADALRAAAEAVRHGTESLSHAHRDDEACGEHEEQCCHHQHHCHCCRCSCTSCCGHHDAGHEVSSEYQAEHHCECEGASPPPPYPPYPPPPPYPPTPPYPPFPPYPPYIVIAGSGCGCHGTQVTAGLMPTPATGVPGVAPASSPPPSIVSAQITAASGAGAAARTTPTGVASPFPDPSRITDFEALMELGKNAAAMVRQMVPAEKKPQE